MQKITGFLDNILKVLMLVLVLSIVLCVLLQVFYRYIFDGYLGWTEELARYAMVWTVFIGMAYGFGHGEHLIVDIFTYKLPKEKAHRFTVASWLVSLLFCISMLFVSLSGVKTVAANNWTTLPFLSYKYVYYALPVGLGLSSFYLIGNLINELKAIMHRTGGRGS